MIKKEQQVQIEALEIIELAIDDLTTLARAFNLVSDLAVRNCDFSKISFESDAHEMIH